ncbi:hypothetical protein H0H92_001586, partial [Tricholoma furcatifolium]
LPIPVLHPKAVRVIATAAPPEAEAVEAEKEAGDDSDEVPAVDTDMQLKNSDDEDNHSGRPDTVTSRSATKAVVKGRGALRNEINAAQQTAAPKTMELGEKKTLFAVLLKALKLVICAIIGRPAIPGYIVIETDTVENAWALCSDISDIVGLPIPVAAKDSVQWLQTSTYFPLPGSWVRMTRKFSACYAGDLAWVYATPLKGLSQVLLLPRFDPSLSYDQERPEPEEGKRRRKPCPPLAPLSFNEAVRIFGRKKLFSPVDSDENMPIFNDFFDIRLGRKSCLIYHGLLLVLTLDFEPSEPTDGELQFFYSFSAFAWLQKDPDCQAALINLAASRLQAGDPVEVVEDLEPLRNETGVVIAVKGDIATVQIDMPQLQKGVAILLVALRAVYQVSNYIKVVHGECWRKTGFIVKKGDTLLTINDHQKSSNDPLRDNARPPVPFSKAKTYDPYLGRQVQIISSKNYKGYEGYIVKRMDNNDTQVEVEVVAQLAYSKAPHIIVPLFHLADLSVSLPFFHSRLIALFSNDPHCRPLMQVYTSAKNTPFSIQKIIPEHPPPWPANFPLSSRPLLPTIHDLCQAPPCAAATLL